MEMFFRKVKLKKEFDDKLVAMIHETKEQWQQSKIIEELADDYDLDATVTRKKAESIHFYLYKEARIRKVMLG